MLQKKNSLAEYIGSKVVKILAYFDKDYSRIIDNKET
jgi:hypothetical protein